MSRKKVAPKAPEATGFLIADGNGELKPVTTDQLLEAARELAAKRLARGIPLNSPSKVRECLPALLGSYTHERFGVLFLDSQNRLIAYEEMFRGTLTSTVVYPREIVKAALGHNATSMILAHDQPSGTLEHSQADIQITQRVKEALGLLEIQVAEHFIATCTTAVSMEEKGALVSSLYWLYIEHA